MNNEVFSGPTRRQVLTGAGLLALQHLAAARFANAAQDKVAPKTRPVLIGSGEHTYECWHDWLMPPPDKVLWGDTQGIAQDSQGRIYISHTVHPNSPTKDAIAVFDADGNFLTSWGSRFVGGGHGIHVRRENNTEYLYHCDTAHRQVVKTRLDGTVVWEIGAPVEAGVYNKDPQTGKANPFVPTNVAFAPNGDFFLGDGYGSSYVHRYNRHGDWQQIVSTPGSEPGKCNTPHSLWVDPRTSEPLLAVADRSNHRLQYFTLDSKHAYFATDGMRRPCNVTYKDDLMVVPDLDGVVTLMDGKNKMIAQLGDGFPSDKRGKPRETFTPGKFIHPHDALFLANGDILIAEWVPIGRVTLLRKVGAKKAGRV